jgi:glutamate racemase
MPALQRRFDVPMIGVITPGAEEAVRRTERRRIGVIGTTGTVGSRAYDAAIAERAPDCIVEGIACPLFVPLAEEGWVEGDVPRRVAETYLRPLRESGIDTVILGCTHYPILRSTIGEVLGEGITLIDTAESTVREVCRRLESLDLLRIERGEGSQRFFLSDVPVRFGEIGGRFLGEPIQDLTWIEQSDIPWYERSS